MTQFTMRRHRNRKFTAEAFKAMVLPIEPDDPTEDPCWSLPGSPEKIRWGGAKNPLQVSRLAAHYYGILPDMTQPYLVGRTCKNLYCCNPKHLYLRGATRSVSRPPRRMTGITP
jgi:hypothetical protein